jgi:hypothetical protein
VFEGERSQPSGIDGRGGDPPLRILQVASPWVPVPPEQYGGSEWIVLAL